MDSLVTTKFRFRNKTNTERLSFSHVALLRIGKFLLALKTSGLLFKEPYHMLFMILIKLSRLISMIRHPNLGEDMNIVHPYVPFSFDVISITLG